MSQHCLAQHAACVGHRAAKCCDLLGVVWSNLTSFKLEPTARNMSQQGGQTRATCYAQHYWDMLRLMLRSFGRGLTICCVEMLRSFGRGLRLHQEDYITPSATLVLPQTQKLAGGKISGLEKKSFTRQKSPDSELYGFKVATRLSEKNSTLKFMRSTCGKSKLQLKIPDSKSLET